MRTIWCLEASRQNFIGDDGLKSISGALKNLKSLELLDLCLEYSFF